MKKAVLAFIFILSFFTMTAQVCNNDNEDSSAFLRQYDLSPIWMKNDLDYIGYIGNNYQRLFINLSEVRKLSPTTYTVKGETKVKSNLCSFEGTITIIDLKRYTELHYGVDDFMKGKVLEEGEISATFSFAEKKEQPGSGFFSGVVTSFWYIDPNYELCYDNICLDSDFYCNNQFSGNWTSYNTGKVQKCAWGHYRIPDSGDLDFGAAEFSPNKKYHTFGWEDYDNF